MLTRRTFLAVAAASPLYRSALNTDKRVTLGVCTSDVASAANYGFDYIEPAAAEIAAMSDDQFRQYSEKVLASPLRCDALNGFIRRPDLKVVGENVPMSALSDYAEQCLARCRLVGASVVVWGSAGSRNVPEGFPRPRAQQQIAEFLRMTGEIAKRHGIVLAIEPLRHQECNILNTGAEALEMVRTVKHPNVRMIIDYYHMREENEGAAILETGKHEIVHLHFANPHGRVWPRELSEDDHYREFFGYLKKTDYSGGISIEGKGSFDHDGAASRAFLQKALSEPWPASAGS